MTTLSHLLPPPVFIKVLPETLIPCIDICIEFEALLEHEVLDQVGCQEWCPPIIEGFKDDLIIIVRPQVDRHDLEVAMQYLREQAEALAGLVGVARYLRPITDGLQEEDVSLIEFAFLT